LTILVENDVHYQYHLVVGCAFRRSRPKGPKLGSINEKNTERSMSGSRTRRLHVANKLGLACVAATCFLAACGDSDDSSNGTPNGGAAGNASKAGSGNAGKAGSASAGHGGASAGSGQAGDENVAGETGDGGEAGENGGSTAGNGGTAGGGIVTAGSGGSSVGGSGGSGGGVALVPNCVRDTTSGKKVEISATGNDGLFAAAYGPDGKLYAAGYTQNGVGSAVGQDRSTVVVRLTETGALDPSWDTGGVVTVNVKVTASDITGLGELPRGLAFQGDKLIVSGTVETYTTLQTNKLFNDDRDVYVLRLNADGSLDKTFGDDDVVTPANKTGIHILPLSAGVLNTAGTALSGADAQWGLNVLPSGEIIVTAATRSTAMTTDTVPVPRTDTDFAVVKLTADGAQDATFGLVGGTPGVFQLDVAQAGASVRTASVLSDGKLIITGYASYGGTQRPVIFKLLANGSALDTSFGAAGIFSEPVGTAAEAYGALVQSSGKLVTVGYGRATASTSASDIVSIRLTASGVLDTTYGTASGRTWFDVAGLGDNGRAILLSDDRPVLFGGGSLSSGQQDAVITVLSVDGKTLGSLAAGGSGGTGGVGGSGGSAGAFTSFGTPFGCKAYDFGSVGDFFWSGARATDGKIAAVGLTGHAQGSTDDTDGIIVLIDKP